MSVFRRPLAHTCIIFPLLAHAHEAPVSPPGTTVYVKAQFLREPDTATQRRLRQEHQITVIDRASTATEYFIKIGVGSAPPPEIASIAPITPQEKTLEPIPTLRAARVLSSGSQSDRRCEITVSFFEPANSHSDTLLAAGLEEVRGWTDLKPTRFTSRLPHCTDQSLQGIVTRLTHRNEVRSVSLGLIPHLAVNRVGFLTGSYQTQWNDIIQGLGHYRGSNRTVGIWDIHKVFDTHPDFTARLVPGDDSDIAETIIEELAPEAADHATLCAGVLGGDGRMSNGVYRGMAPEAEIVTFNVFYAFMEMSQASRPRDGISGHYGLAAASNSWHYLGEDNQLGYFSEQAHNAAEINEAALASPNMLIAFAAGNSRACIAGGTEYQSICALNTRADVECNRFGLYPSGSEYGCLYRPSDAKNVMTVGATDSWLGNNIASYSSFGPTRDGRIKPDIVAPGSRIQTTTTLGFENGEYYTNNDTNGTSMATPAIAGIATQLSEHLDKLETIFNRIFIERATLLKALLIHTATDIEAPGPDYRSGWGRVHLPGAVRISSYPGSIVQDRFSDFDFREPKCYSIEMPQLIPAEFKATLVWMDQVPHERPTTHPGGLSIVHPDYLYELQNDLDLTLRDGSGTTILALPYLLDPLRPEKIAATGFDRKNNVEQIRISGALLAQAIPPGGTFSICVDFFRAPATHQPFTLILGDGINFGTLCGNGIVDHGIEECDASSSADPIQHKSCGDFASLFSQSITPLAPQGRPSCSRSCRIDLTACVAPNCGNGVVDEGEFCDPSAPQGMCFRPGAPTHVRCEDCYPPEAGPVRACRPKASNPATCEMLGSNLFFVANQEVCIESPLGDSAAGIGSGPPHRRRGCRLELHQDPESFLLFPLCVSKANQRPGGSCSTNAAPDSGGIGTCQMQGTFWMNSCGCH